MKKDILPITESAILIAMALILDFIFGKYLQVLRMPQGGTFSLAMLPILVIGLRHGLKYGIMGGFVFGILNFIMDGILWHWGSIFFDYLFAGMALGITGLFYKKRNYAYLILALFLGGFMKFFFHTVGGVLFFADYARDAGYTTVLGFIYYSLAYNIAYMGPSIIACVVVGVLIKNIIYLNVKNSYN